MKGTRKDSQMTRRSFLKTMAMGSASIALGSFRPESAGAVPKDTRYLASGASDITSLDPHDHLDVARAIARINPYDGLLRWRDNPPKLQPWIAESYQGSPDAKVWVFKIRKDVKFHDGSPVTAEDVVYSIERLLVMGKAIGAELKTLMNPGATVATDQYTVEFRLKQSFAPFPGLSDFFYMVNKKVLQKYEKDGDWGNKWLATHGTVLGADGVGTGSYTIEKYEPTWGFDAVRFENHFSPWNQPHFEKFGFRTVRESATRVLGLMNGDYHSELGYLPYDQLQKVSESPKVRVVRESSTRLFFAIFNNAAPPMNDAHFRRALSYAFDYDGWINNVQHGMVEPINGPIPGPMWGSLNPKEKTYKFDLDMAKKELSMATVDWKKLQPIVMSPLMGFPMALEGAQLLQNGMTQIGIQSRIEPRTSPQLTELGIQGKYPPIVWTWCSTYYPDPHNWARLYDSSQWGSWFGSSRYKNAQVDEFLKKAVSISNQEERTKLYQQAMKIVVEEAAGLFVHNERWSGTVSKDIKGIRFCPVGDINEVRWMSWS